MHSAGECYACTQVGAPAFHSTSCDHAHPPEWEANAGSSLIPIQNLPTARSARGGGAAKLGKLGADSRSTWIFGRVLDPRSKRVHRWNRGFLLARALALAIDPLFFYALSIGSGGATCFFMDAGIALFVTALRTVADVVHVFHIWLQFRLAYISKESLVVGCGKLVWDARAIAAHYVLSPKRFWFDIFVILPMPQVSVAPPSTGSWRPLLRVCSSISNVSQVVLWLIVPKLIRGGRIKLAVTILLFVFLFQFLPKVYHSIATMRRMQKVTGYIFGTIWWGFALNLAAYFIASHVSRAMNRRKGGSIKLSGSQNLFSVQVAGGCWYVLAIQRVASCLRHECEVKNSCGLVPLACSKELCYRIPLPRGLGDYSCSRNLTMAASRTSLPECLKPEGAFPYGIYSWALPVVSADSAAVKILYPIFWGLMTLRFF